MSRDQTMTAEEPTPDKGSTAEWLRDALASVVVFLVALPLCIGIAVACGVPAEKGILTGIVGGIIVGSIAGSPLLVSGPAASLIVPVYQVVDTYGLVALGPVVMLAGLWQVLAGLFGLGQWFRAVAPAVITGMLMGIGILIFGSQLHVAIDGDPAGSFVDNILALGPAMAARLSPPWEVSQVAPMILGAVTIGAIVGWERVRPRALELVPGHLVSLALVTSAAYAFSLPIRFLDISPNFFASIDPVGTTELAMLTTPKLFGLSFIFAFVASAATLLTAAAIDQRQSHTRTNYNREMLAQGVGNLISGGLGSLPMTGVIVRSSVNVDAGARTRRSTILHGFWLLIFVAVAPQVLELIPRASLGAILVYTGYKLINLQTLRELYARGRAELLIALVTIFGVVFIELFEGIVLGLGFAIAKLVYGFTHLEVRSETSETDDTHHLHLAGSATFLRLPLLAEALEKIPAGRVLHVHVEELEYIDHACLELLSHARKQRQGQNGPGLMVAWDELAARYDPAFRMGRGPASQAQRSVPLLRVLWEEWRRLYATRRPSDDEDDAALTDDWLGAERIRVGLEAEELGDVLDEATALLAPVAGLETDVVAEALGAGNAESCVVIAEGVGLPHASLPRLGHPLAALVTTAEPITVGDDQLDMFFVLLAPQGKPRIHLVALAHVGRLCHEEASLSALREASTSDEAMAVITEAEAELPGRRARVSNERNRYLLAVIEVAGGATEERALIELIEESESSVPAATDLSSLAPLARLLDIDESRRVVILNVHEDAAEPFRRLLSESAMVLGCEVRLHLLRAELPSAAG